MSYNKVTGIVLAGGKSSRMGKDKGLCTFYGKPMVLHAVELLRQVCDNIIISSNNPDYSQFGLPVVEDEIKNIGPLGGIYSGLKQTKSQDNFFLSCDMPMVTTDLVKYIVSEKEGFEIVIPMFNGLPEPLCAYYNKQITDEMLEIIKSGEYKIQEIAKNFKVKFLPIDLHLPFYSDGLFTNINSQKDLDTLERLTDSGQ
jgi:molybdopterin-guanine dinucleotide biosynthesis protein A